MSHNYCFNVSKYIFTGIHPVMQKVQDKEEFLIFKPYLNFFMKSTGKEVKKKKK